MHGYTVIILSVRSLYSDSSNFANRDEREPKKGLNEEVTPSSVEELTKHNLGDSCFIEGHFYGLASMSSETYTRRIIPQGYQ